MKNNVLLPLFLLLLPATGLHAQAVSINTDAGNPDPSAILDVKSTEKGMLVPRMSTAQRTAIAAPATGLLVFDTNTGSFWFYTGTAWADLSAQKQLADADADTKIQVEESPDEDIIRFDLAGVEHLVLRKNISGAPRLELPNALNNIFIGKDAGNANTTGNNNTALGTGVLSTNTTGYDNTANGHFALFSNLSGNSNTAHGMYALYNNSTGSLNTAVGLRALYSNTDRSGNVAVGDFALYTNGVGADYFEHASNNTAIGSKALYNNSTGFENTAVGTEALMANVEGHGNTANGFQALNSNISGGANSALGERALYNNTTGSGNTAVGSRAGEYHTTGYFNTYIGFNNNEIVSSASNNTAVGGWNEYGLVSNAPFGSENTYLGSNTGSSSTQGNRLTLIGKAANIYDIFNSPSITTATAIGYNALVNCSHCLVLGGIGPDSVDVGIGLHTPVSDLHIVQKNGSAGLNKLGVRLQDRDGTFWNTYVDFADDYNFAFNGALTAYIQDGTGTYVAVSDARLKTGVVPLESVLEGVVKLQPKWYHRTGYEDRPKTPGFLAQEVETVFPQLVCEKDGIKGLAYDNFGVLAIKAIQEQQAEIEALRAENAALKAQLDAQASVLLQITAALQKAGIAVEKR